MCISCSATAGICRQNDTDAVGLLAWVRKWTSYCISRYFTFSNFVAHIWDKSWITAGSFHQTEHHLRNESYLSDVYQCIYYWSMNYNGFYSMNYINFTGFYIIISIEVWITLGFIVWKVHVLKYELYWVV